jgi:hypothetical protein
LRSAMATMFSTGCSRSSLTTSASPTTRRRVATHVTPAMAKKRKAAAEKTKQLEGTWYSGVAELPSAALRAPAPMCTADDAMPLTQAPQKAPTPTPNRTKGAV